MAKRKTVKKRNALKSLAVIALIVALVISLGLSVKEIVELHSQQKELLKEKEKLKEEKANLSKELKNVNDPEYIEEQARKQLRMIKPGEQIYIIDEKNNKQQNNTNNNITDEENESEKKTETASETG